MGEMTNNNASLSAGIDLSQFFQVFFEEAGENLEQMERMLLALDVQAPDDEELNAIFRCAHSVKGGAATFGFTDVAELTHQMETLLDKLRRHELNVTPPMVDVLLQSGDALTAQLARHQGNGADPIDTADLLRSIRALVDGQAAPAPRGRCRAGCDRPGGPVAPVAPAGKPQPRTLVLTVGPLEDVTQAEQLFELFQEITDLGTIDPIDGGQAADGLRRFRVVTTTADSELLDLCTFHVAREHLRLEPATAGYGFYPGSPGAPVETAAPAADPGLRLLRQRPRCAGVRPPRRPAVPARPNRRPWPRRRRCARLRAPRRRRPTPSRARCVCRSRRSTS
jgi:two-component system chemotaxis sensor kinase CheA